MGDRLRQNMHQDDQAILEFLERRVEVILDSGEYGSIQLKAVEGITLSSIWTIWGQAGPHFSDFGIFVSKAKCVESFINSGWVIWGSNPKKRFSNIESQLVSMYKKNIYQRFSGLAK